ncbi:hypothetical protein ECDEC1A_5296 [Escherichia coli DEC1A]|nr:hypothetical protein ECDEC1A_5296 [Escherichia coli DEC1A]
MARSAPRLQWRVVPCAGGPDNEAGLFFPTSAVPQITVWRKIFRTCLKKMPPAIMKQPYG